MGYYLYIIASVLILPTIIYAIITQNNVNKTFKSFSAITASVNKTANEVARMMLDNAGLQDVKITNIKGELTDNYNPKTKTLSLSTSTYNSSSVSAIGVAAHEVGHAIQHSSSYVPLKIRTILVPIVNLCSWLSIPLLIVGIILSSIAIIAPETGEIIVWIAIAFYGSSTIFQLVTLPVEFNASKRALANLENLNLLTEEEIPLAKKVLDAAAKTYIASFAMSALYFLRFLGRILMIFGRNRD